MAMTAKAKIAIAKTTSTNVKARIFLFGHSPFFTQRHADGPGIGK
jgi:hypothetical protein